VDANTGTPLPEQSCFHEQVLNWFEVKFGLIHGGETMRLKAGQASVISSNEPHSGRATTKFRIVNLFHQVLKDFVNMNLS
jgi:hypothetical protein